MPTLKKYKNIIIALLIILVIYIVYIRFSGSDEALLLSESAPQNEIDRELVRMLAQLNSITLDDSFFKDITFTSFEDFGVEIAPQPISRPNPFAPLGSDAEVE